MNLFKLPRGFSCFPQPLSMSPEPGGIDLRRDCGNAKSFQQFPCAVCIPLPPSVSTQPLPLLWLPWWNISLCLNRSPGSQTVPLRLPSLTKGFSSCSLHCKSVVKTKQNLQSNNAWEEASSLLMKRCYVLLFLQTRQ